MPSTERVPIYPGNWDAVNSHFAALESSSASQFGLKSWTHLPNIGPSAMNYVTQKVFLASLYLTQGDILSNIWIGVLLASAGTPPTTIKLGIYNSDASARMAVTANVNADPQWLSLGYKSFPFTAPFTVPASGVYQGAFLMDGAFVTTAGQMMTNTNIAAPGPLNGVFTHSTGGVAQTDLVAPLTPAVTTQSVWFGVS